MKVADDEADFYGKKYWLEHQNKDLGFPNIFQRAKLDLTDRNLHWLKTLLKYKAPPSKVLELGCSHGSFVALLRQAGYEASGMEMSPWVVEFAQETFDIPMLVGPVENIELEVGTFDVVALMDVLEHLPDPVGTMSHALRLLKPHGILLIQTPQAKDEMVYSNLVETNAAFMEQFKSDEHLYLFTQSSATALFERLGASVIHFEPPIFHQYDMFFVVSRQPIEMISEEDAEKSIETPKGRFVQALLDQDNRIKALDEHVKIIDADRAARLDQIHALTKMIHELQTAAGK
ncbi:class I SAM-dependent methyltransferase [Agrobacterium sp. rho-8.1]|nr:class I SAM-dependent methyltransferase [Agrobacterium sp. rho-8.1]